MKLTEGQAAILAVVTDEPQANHEIAAAAGVAHGSASHHLMALKQKGLVERTLNPTRWRRSQTRPVRLVCDARNRDSITFRTEDLEEEDAPSTSGSRGEG